MIFLGDRGNMEDSITSSPITLTMDDETAEIELVRTFSPLNPFLRIP